MSEGDQAAKDLKQKMSRQKRKPKRLAETDATQNLTPRTGQVLRPPHVFLNAAWTLSEFYKLIGLCITDGRTACRQRTLAQ